MVRIRLAEPRDWARLYSWRNDPETRAKFKQQEIVTLKEHMSWLAKALENPEISLYLASDDENGVAVGTMRLDVVRHKKADWAECSLTIEPSVRGRGYAAHVIQAVIDLGGMWRDSGLIAGLLATVKTDNYASLRAFAACDFTLAQVTDTLATLERAL